MPTKVRDSSRAQKTIFLARSLRSRAVQREIHEGLNVVVPWDRANTVIYPKGGDLVLVTRAAAGRGEAEHDQQVPLGPS